MEQSLFTSHPKGCLWMLMSADDVTGVMRPLRLWSPIRRGKHHHRPIRSQHEEHNSVLMPAFRRHSCTVRNDVFFPWFVVVFVYFCSLSWIHPFLYLGSVVAAKWWHTLSYTSTLFILVALSSHTNLVERLSSRALSHLFISSVACSISPHPLRLDHDLTLLFSCALPPHVFLNANTEMW